MLLQISIKNFAIFKDVIVEPGESFNVITGESGAGKSVIVNALSLICGARAYKEMIRTGEEFASVEAVFEIPSHKKKVAEQLGIYNDLVVITRVIYILKPSICKINGKIRNLSQIIEISKLFIDIHGQYENQTLLNVENHVKFLDEYADKSILGVLDEYKRVRKKYNSITKSILSVSGGEKERERNIQILKFQIDEIDNAELINYDEKAIKEKREFMENSEKYRKNTIAALKILQKEDESIADNIRSAIKELEYLPKSKPTLKTITGLNETYYRLQESVSELENFYESTEFDEAEYEMLLDKVARINDLKRKYGDSVDNILSFREKAEKQLIELSNFKENYSNKLKKLERMERQLESLDEKLTKIRKDESISLVDKLLSELKDMGMKDSVIKVGFEKNETVNSLNLKVFPNTGRDLCEFLISLNKGLSPVTLGKVASGGELSRIMLSFKTVLSYKDDTETVVFDEIDAGISGEASKAVADKLRKLSKNKQIICITHQPQIAAMADNHFLIEKDSSGKVTYASINKMTSFDEKINLIASLTDGSNITKEGRIHAEKLFKENKKYFN